MTEHSPAKGGSARMRLLAPLSGGWPPRIGAANGDPQNRSKYTQGIVGEPMESNRTNEL